MQRFLSLSGRLTVKTQADLNSTSSAKRFTALKISLSLKFLAIQNLPDFTLESLISIRSVWPWWNFHMPEALKAFWSATGKKSSVWSRFLFSSCCFVQNSNEIGLVLKAALQEMEDQTHCLHCSQHFREIKRSGQTELFFFINKYYFFSSAMLFL